MSATLAAPRPAGGHAQILGAVGRKFKMFFIIAVPVALIAMVLTFTFGGWDMTAKAMPSLLAFSLIFVWWSAFMALQAQNHPIAARLVPGQLRQLREVAVGLFLGLALTAGALMSLVDGSFLLWAIVGGAACFALSILTRWPLLWTLVWVVPSTAGIWLKSPAWRMVVAVMQGWHERQPVTQAALALGLMGFMLWRLFQSGGPTHGQQYLRAQAMRQAMKEHAFGGRVTNLFPEGRLALFFRHLFCWLRVIWREHLVRRATSTPRSALARAELVANPGTHWSMVIGTSLVIIAGVLIAFAVGFAITGDRGHIGLRNAVSGFAFGVMSMLINPVMATPSALYKRRREQALLLLLPGMPRGEALNRGLARRQFLQFLGCWGFGLSLIVGLQVAMDLQSAGSSSTTLFSMGLNYSTIALPAGLLLWRDWSRQGEPNGSHMALLVMGLVACMLGLGVLVSKLDISPWLFMGISVALTAVGIVVRWRRVVTRPTFWPVGRWS
ncbi:hypothetical protein [Roseateles amylovorans]|uniref:ABC transporter permease n=1 Tax=Roseateles amylovorans TaxID=2978473 RepID=A0ABY6B0Q3_9BURK|nr:hypothetical protein [Roseateles amylovorans]UXH78249.1 hypothetical protein N4261_25420 [Roseateles amylovorans]